MSPPKPQRAASSQNDQSAEDRPDKCIEAKSMIRSPFAIGMQDGYALRYYYHAGRYRDDIEP